MHLRKAKYNLDEQTIKTVANRTEGWSGADIESLCNEAGYRALRKKDNGDRITDEDLLDSLGSIRRATY